MLHFDVTGLVPAHEAEFVNGDPVLSPSQLSTFNMCPRKWAARYLHGQQEAPAPSTLAGTRMHKVLADYFTDHVVPRPEVPEGQWALALIAKGDLPLPGPGVIAERKFKFEYDGVWWRGSKDLVYDRDDHRVIRDHKSTSELNPMWMKTPETLLTDPQSVIYAWDEYRSGATAVRNEWGYVTRQRYPKVLVVRADIPPGDSAMATHTATGKRILQIYRDRPEINDLPPDGTHTGGCEAFGGCKVVGCDVTALDRIKGLQLFNARRMNMGYLDDLRAKQAVKAVTTPVPEETSGLINNSAGQPPVGIGNTAVYAPPHIPTVRERLADVVPPPFDPPPPPPPVVGAVPAMPPWLAGPAAPAVPPPAHGPVPGGAPRTRGRKRAAEPQPFTAPPEAYEGRTHAPAPTPTVPPVETYKTGITVVPGGAPRTAPTPTAQIGKTYPGAIVPAIGFGGVPMFGSDGYNLCINTVPLGACVLFSQWVAVVHQALADKTPHYPLMGFDGVALYQDALRQAIEQDPPSGDLYVDSRTNEGRDALAILERNAVKVYRGV